MGAEDIQRLPKEGLTILVGRPKFSGIRLVLQWLGLRLAAEHRHRVSKLALALGVFSTHARRNIGRVEYKDRNRARLRERHKFSDSTLNLCTCFAADISTA